MVFPYTHLPISTDDWPVGTDKTAFLNDLPYLSTL
jgi:hypothetical protein